MAVLAGACGGGERVDAVDHRIVDGALPVSGESMGSVRWLREQVFRARLPAIRGCMEDRGHPELVAVAEADFEQANELPTRDFPEPQRMLGEGLLPSPEPAAFQDDPSGAFLSCTGERVRPERGDGARLVDLYEVLFQAWTPMVTRRVRESEEEAAAQEAFGECLRRRGVPAEATEPASGGTLVEPSFLAWVERNVRSGAVPSPAMEDAERYVACGQPLWDRREAQLRELRRAMVESHRTELDALDELVGR